MILRLDLPLRGEVRGQAVRRSPIQGAEAVRFLRLSAVPRWRPAQGALEDSAGVLPWGLEPRTERVLRRGFLEAERVLRQVLRLAEQALPLVRRLAERDVFAVHRTPVAAEPMWDVPPDEPVGSAVRRLLSGHRAEKSLSVPCRVSQRGAVFPAWVGPARWAEKNRS